MRKAFLASVLLAINSHAYADCPSIDGNWFMSTATKPSAARAFGSRYGSSQIHIKINGNSVVVNSGIGVGLNVDNQSVSFDYDQGTTGNATQNPNNCRLRMTINFTFQSVGVSDNSSFRGDYVKITKGYAGKANGNSGGVVTPGTFEMTPE